MVVGVEVPGVAELFQLAEALDSSRLFFGSVNWLVFTVTPPTASVTLFTRR